jgi:hypothetical protein
MRERTNNMSIYMIEIPIPDYYGEKVFYQKIFFEGDRCPTKEEVYTQCVSNHMEDSQYPEYTGDWETVMGSISRVDEWPIVGPSLYSHNSFTDVIIGKESIRAPLTITNITSKIHRVKK